MRMILGTIPRALSFPCFPSLTNVESGTAADSCQKSPTFDLLILDPIQLQPYWMDGVPVVVYNMQSQLQTGL